MTDQKPQAAFEAVEAHPFQVLQTVALSGEARTAKGVMMAQLVRGALGQADAEGADGFDANVIAAAKYANTMRDQTLRNFAREVDAVKGAAANLTDMVAKANAAGERTEDVTEKEVKTALTNGLFHATRVNLDFFWDFSTALISQERTRETMAAALSKALDLQIEVFAKIHEGFAAISTENLPEWEPIKAQMVADKDELMSITEDNGEECDCPGCTAEREAAAEEQAQPKNGQADPVAQTIH